MDKEVIQTVEKLYGIHIFYIDKIRDVYRLTTDHGEVCLKNFDYKLKKFLYIYHAMEHLRKKGFTQLPAIIHTLAGDPYFSYNHKNYFLCEWIKGRESNFKNLVDLELAIIALARMHFCSIGFKPPAKVKLKSRLGIWPERFKKRRNDLVKFKEMALSKKRQSRVDKYFLKHVDKRIKDCEKAIELIDTPQYHTLVKVAKEEGVFCHNDFVYHNVLINEEKLEAYIIDFDYCRHDLRVYDLSRVIRRVIKNKKYHRDYLDIILSTYNSEYPLLAEEYTIIAAFLQFPQRFWRIADRYYNQKRKWSEKTFYSELKQTTEKFRHQKSLIKEIMSYAKKIY